MLLLALGETILSVGATFAIGRGRVTTTEILGLLVAFVTAVLLWRIYFYRAGQILAKAVEASTNPALLGQRIGAAHVFMVLGIAFLAAGSEDVLAQPGND